MLIFSIGIFINVCFTLVSEGGNSWLENNKPRTEVIVFSVLGGVVFVIVMIIIICMCQRRKKNPETESIVIK